MSKWKSLVICTVIVMVKVLEKYIMMIEKIKEMEFSNFDVTIQNLCIKAILPSVSGEWSGLGCLIDFIGEREVLTLFSKESEDHLRLPSAENSDWDTEHSSDAENIFSTGT